MRSVLLAACCGLLAIPVIWGTDAVHGHNNAIGAALFPHDIGLGATRNLDPKRSTQLE